MKTADLDAWVTAKAEGFHEALHGLNEWAIHVSKERDRAFLKRDMVQYAEWSAALLTAMFAAPCVYGLFNLYQACMHDAKLAQKTFDKIQPS